MEGIHIFGKIKVLENSMETGTEKIKMLVVDQPTASTLVLPARFEGGDSFPVFNTIIRKSPTGYRGKVLVASAKGDHSALFPSECLIGFLDLYDVKPMSELSDKDLTFVDPDDRNKQGYAYFFRNPKRCIEYPMHGFTKRGFYNLEYQTGSVAEYPENLKVEYKDLETLIPKQKNFLQRIFNFNHRKK